MVFTANQTTAFFEDPDQMAIPDVTRNQLQQEGITFVDDLSDFDDESLKQIAENLRRPGGTIANPNGGPGATMPTPPFVFGAKSQLRLKAAATMVRHYETVGRELSAANMKWDPMIKNFIQHWKALEDRKAADEPEVPRISKTLVVTKWTEAFHDFLHRVIGHRNIPLAYVVRDTVDVPAAAPDLLPNQPYAEKFGSVEAELIARASHSHPLYREDNAQIYYYLEEATRSTSYAASIKPFQRAKDGRGALLAMVRQYAGEDKWRAELKRQDELIHTRKWKGNTNFSLERFIAQHRNAYVSMTQCAEHVSFQLPNENTRVTYLLDAIECNDAPLQAAMALVRNDTDETGKMNDFEATASFLLPHDPVSKKRVSAKGPVAQVSSASSSASTSVPLKVGTGKTGVSLRFHTKEEYAALSKEQRNELHEYRNAQEAAGKGRKLSTTSSANNGGKKMRRMVSQAVATQLKDNAKKDATSAADEDTLRQYLVSLVNSQPTPQPATWGTPATSNPAPTWATPNANTRQAPSWGHAPVSAGATTATWGTPTAAATTALPPPPPPQGPPPPSGSAPPPVTASTIQSILKRAKKGPT